MAKSQPERYLEQALRMIDRSGGSHGVNLREVARELGVSHTNAYNYFADLEALLSQALEVALQRQFEHSRQALATAKGSPLRRLERLMDSQVEFALAHPGWYHFVWLEPLRGPPSPGALSLMTEAGAGLAALIREAAPSGLTAPQAAQRAEDLHTYLHGLLCKAIAGRVASPADPRPALRLAARRMLRTLVVREGGR